MLAPLGQDMDPLGLMHSPGRASLGYLLLQGGTSWLPFLGLGWEGENPELGVFGSVPRWYVWLFNRDELYLPIHEYLEDLKKDNWQLGTEKLFPWIFFSAA